jgi:hypothetical protein
MEKIKEPQMHSVWITELNSPDDVDFNVVIKSQRKLIFSVFQKSLLHNTYVDYSGCFPYIVTR